MIQNTTETNEQQAVNKLANEMVMASTSIRRWTAKGFIPKTASDAVATALTECRNLASEQSSEAKSDLDSKINKAFFSFAELEPALDSNTPLASGTTRDSVVSEATRQFTKDFGVLRQSILDLNGPELAPSDPSSLSL